MYQEFTTLDSGKTRLPFKSTILRFRHLLEAHGLGQQILTTANAKVTDSGLVFKTGTEMHVAHYNLS
jgi:IS5 family transposase